MVRNKSILIGALEVDGSCEEFVESCMPHYELIKVSRDGNYGTNIIGTVDEYEMIYNLEEGGGMTFLWTPFGRSPSWAVAHSDILYYGWSDEIEIITASADGSTRDTIRYEHDPVPITDALKQCRRSLTTGN